MRIYVDSTEPGAIYLALRQYAEKRGIPVERTMLHKRVGAGPSLRQTHPLYGRGADFVITDDATVPIAAIERKSLDDLARSFSAGREADAPRLFRQIADLRAHPMPILLLEGSASSFFRRVEPSILGFQFWAMREGISLIYTSSVSASARAVGLLAARLARDYDMKVQPGAPFEEFDLMDPDEKRS